MDGHDRQEPRPYVSYASLPLRSRSSSSSSSSSDERPFSLPSVKLLASKFSSLDLKGTVANPPQPKAPPTATSNKIAGGRQLVPSAPSVKITASSASSDNKPRYSSNKANYSSLPIKPKQVVVTNGRGPAFDDQDDDVFHNFGPTNQRVPYSKVALRNSSSSSIADSDSSKVAESSSWKRHQQEQKHEPVDRSYSRDSTEMFASTRSSLSSVSPDSPKHNVIFGVPLRRLDTISWGVMQRKVSSKESDSDSSSSGDSRSPTQSPSPAPLDSGNKFSTFPKRTQPSVEDHSHKASTLGKKGGGGVRSKIANKLGDKSSPMYHSQSDISSAAVATGLSNWRRKSVSDDVYERHHPPLARRQSISGLLKLYRPKSQGELSQIGDGGSSLPITLQAQKEEPQAKAKTVSTPLKMSDLKIVHPMAKPNVEPYKPATKDIVRLPISQHTIVTKSVHVPAFVAKPPPNNRQDLSSTSSTSDSEIDHSKEVSPPPQQRPKSVQYISRPQHFNRPQVLNKPNPSPAKPSLIAVMSSKPTSLAANTTKPVLVSPVEPISTTARKPSVKEGEPTKSLKRAPLQKSTNVMKLTRMITPPSYPGYSEPIRDQAASTRSFSSSSSSSSDSDDEISRKLQESISKQKITEPIVKISPVSVIISSLNNHTSKPVCPPKIVLVTKNVTVTKPRMPSWKSYNSDDEPDGIPHDDKMPSFIVPSQPKKNAIVISKINVDKPITTNKTQWKPVSQVVRQNKFVSDDTDGFPHDEKVPSFVVTKPAQKVVMNPSDRLEQKKEPPAKSSSRSPLTKTWPPEAKARSNSSSSDSTIKNSGEGYNPPREIVLPPRTNYNDPNSPSSSSSESDFSDNEKQKGALNVKTGFYEVNKEVLPVEDRYQKKIAVHIKRKSSSSDSTEEERKDESLVKIDSQIEEPRVVAVKQAKVSLLAQDNKQRPKPSNIPKPTVTLESPNKLILQGDSLPSVINIRAEPMKTFSRKSSSSSNDSASPTPTKIPTFKLFGRTESLTSDEEVKFKVKRSTKALESHKPSQSTEVKQTAKPPESPKPSQNTSTSKKISAINDEKLDRNKDERRSSSSNSGGEQFEGFDPFAISRMIVKGSRKSDSHVKKPEHLTSIMNATIPVHSPFSPLKTANAKKAEPEAPKAEGIPTRLLSTASSRSSSSSDDDDDGLDFLNDGEQEGVFSANIVIVD